MGKAEKQFVIYSRKSRFTGKGESIENQIELCRQYIGSHFGAEEAEKALVYEDEGFSGGTMERPQFKQMMQDSRTKRFAAIVVYRLDRISRNIGDFAKLIEDLGNRKIDFISIREQFDTSSPMGRAMMYIASVFSQLERETIAERIRDNMHELAKTGRWLGGTTPTGYASESVSHVTVDGKVKKACKLKPVPEELQLVTTIFEQFVRTGSLTKVDRFLLEHHSLTKTGKQFTRFSIKGILSNPVYMIADEAAYTYLTSHQADLFSDRGEFDGVHGIMAYNRTLQRPGQTHQINPMEDWIVSVGKHPGVIPGETWVQVQCMLAQNRSKAYRKPRSHVALLSGLLICGRCGSYMRPKQTDRRTADGAASYTYLCTTKERSCGRCCSMKNANGNQLDALVLAELQELHRDSSDCARQIAEAKSRITGSRRDDDSGTAQAKAQLRETEAHIRRLVASLNGAAGTPAEQYIIAQIGELHDKRKALQERLETTESVRTQPALPDPEFDCLRQTLSRFGGTVSQMPVEQKRAALHALIQKVVWDGEQAHLYFLYADGGKGPLGENSK